MNWRIVVLAAAAGVLIVTSVVLAVMSWEGARAPQTASEADRAAALARDYAPTAGNPQAKVHIVEFMDPACETCREFYPMVKQLMARYPDRVKLSVRHIPLHKGSDQVVRMLEAAKRQDRYWQALEALLAAQSLWTIDHKVIPDLALQHLAPVGIDVARLKVDMAAPEVDRAMQQDMQDARTLKVVQTPEYFVNGKGLPSFGYEQLRQLVDDAVGASYR